MATTPAAAATGVATTTTARRTAAARLSTITRGLGQGRRTRQGQGDTRQKQTTSQHVDPSRPANGKRKRTAH
jgi:hypothetical protein